MTGENKQAIADKLAEVLKMTRAGSDLEGIHITADESVAVLVFTANYARYVCIEADSGIAMIRDICREF